MQQQQQNFFKDQQKSFYHNFCSQFSTISQRIINVQYHTALNEQLIEERKGHGEDDLSEIEEENDEKDIYFVMLEKFNVPENMEIRTLKQFTENDHLTDEFKQKKEEGNKFQLVYDDETSRKQASINYDGSEENQSDMSNDKHTLVSNLMFDNTNSQIEASPNFAASPMKTSGNQNHITSAPTQTALNPERNGNQVRSGQGKNRNIQYESQDEYNFSYPPANQKKGVLLESIETAPMISQTRQKQGELVTSHQDRSSEFLSKYDQRLKVYLQREKLEAEKKRAQERNRAQNRFSPSASKNLIGMLKEELSALSPQNHNTKSTGSKHEHQRGVRKSSFLTKDNKQNHPSRLSPQPSYKNLQFADMLQDFIQQDINIDPIFEQRGQFFLDSSERFDRQGNFYKLSLVQVRYQTDKNQILSYRIVYSSEIKSQGLSLAMNRIFFSKNGEEVYIIMQDSFDQLKQILVFDPTTLEMIKQLDISPLKVSNYQLLNQNILIHKLCLEENQKEGFFIFVELNDSFIISKDGNAPISIMKRKFFNKEHYTLRDIIIHTVKDSQQGKMLEKDVTLWFIIENTSIHSKNQIKLYPFTLKQIQRQSKDGRLVKQKQKSQDLNMMIGAQYKDKRSVHLDDQIENSLIRLEFKDLRKYQIQQSLMRKGMLYIILQMKDSIEQNDDDNLTQVVTVIVEKTHQSFKKVEIIELSDLLLKIHPKYFFQENPIVQVECETDEEYNIYLTKFSEFISFYRNQQGDGDFSLKHKQLIQKLNLNQANLQNYQLDIFFFQNTKVLIRLDFEIYQRVTMESLKKMHGENQNAIQTLNFNNEAIYTYPYLAQMYGNNMMLVSSIYSTNIVYRIDLYTEFVKFIDFNQDQLVIGGQRTLYRHNTLLFMSFDPCTQRINLQSVQLPSLKELNEYEDSKAEDARYTQFRYLSCSRMQLVQQSFVEAKAVSILQLNQGTQDQQTLLLLQMKFEFLIINVEKGEPLFTFQMNEDALHFQVMISKDNSQSFLSQKSDKNAAKGKKQVLIGGLSEFYIIYHDIESGRKIEYLQLLKVSDSYRISVVDSIEYKLSLADDFELLKIQSSNSGKRLYIFDNKMKIATYKIQEDSFVQKKKEVILHEILEDIKEEQEMEKDLQDQIVITKNSLYFKSYCLQRVNIQDPNKAQLLRFEKKRIKEINEIGTSQILIGPLMSQDKSRFLLIYDQAYATEDTKPFDTRLSKQISRRKSLFTSANFGTNTLGISEGNYTSNSLFVPKPSQGRNSVENAIGRKTLNMSIAIKDETESFTDYVIFEGPNLHDRYFSLIHQDACMKDQVQLISFTVQNDILVILDTTILIFDIYGNPLQFSKGSQMSDIIQNTDSRMQIKQIKLNLDTKNTILLFETKEKYLVVILSYTDSIPELRLVESFSKAFYTTANNNSFHEIEEEDKVNPSEILASETIVKINDQADLYAVVIGKDSLNSQRTKVVFYHNFDVLHRASKKISDQLNSSQENSNQLKRSLIRNKKKKKGQLNKQATNKTQSSQQKLLQKNQSIFDFEIVSNQYVALQISLEIYFAKLDDLKYLSELKKIDIQLRKGTIHQIQSTQLDHQIQFSYFQSKPFKYFYLITWDLATNKEVQTLELKPSKEQTLQNYRISKGVSERLNYFLSYENEVFFDVRYEYPCSYFDDITNFFEVKQPDCQALDQEQVTFQSSQMVLQSKQNQLVPYHFGQSMNQIICQSFDTPFLVAQSATLLNYQYMEFLLKQYREAKISTYAELKIMLPLLKFHIDGYNFMHFFSINSTFLEDLYTLLSRTTYEDPDSDSANFIYYILFANCKNESPFDKCMKSYSPKCIELMLDILQLDDTYDYFVHIKKHLHALLELRSEKFESFFEECSQTKSHNVKTIWKFIKDKTYFTNKTCYISDQFILESLKIKQEELIVSQMAESGLQGQNGVSLLSNRNNSEFQRGDFEKFDEKGHDLKHLQKVRFIPSEKKTDGRFVSINFNIYDFGWLIQDNAGQEFISYLAKQRTDSTLYDLEIIQTLINCQWIILRKQIILQQFLPMLFYLVCIIVYNSFLNVNLFSEAAFENTEDDQLHQYQIFHYTFGAFSSLLSIYFIIYGFKKYKQSRSCNNLILLGFNLVVIVTFILDTLLFFDYSTNTYVEYVNSPIRDSFKILSTLIVISCYVIFLLHLRIFDKFAAMVNMIFYVVIGSFRFLIIFFIIIWAFGNTIFVMQSLDAVENGGERLAGPTILTAFMFSYRTALADIQIDSFDAVNRFSWLFYIFFMIQSVIILIALINLLIALMCDIYYQVMLLRKNERYKIKCQIISENEYLFDRKKVFKDAKYIVVAEVEKLERNQKSQNTSSEWNGLINSMQQSLKTALKENQGNFRDDVWGLEDKLRHLASKVEALKAEEDGEKKDKKALAASVELLNGQMEKLVDKIQEIEGRIIGQQNKASGVLQNQQTFSSSGGARPLEKKETFKFQKSLSLFRQQTRQLSSKRVRAATVTKRVTNQPVSSNIEEEGTEQDFE